MRRFAVFCLLVLALPLLAYAKEECYFPTQRVECGDLSCNRTTHKCEPCQTDGDCYERIMRCDNGLCRGKSLKDGFSGYFVGAPVIAFFVCAIAVVAGVGGGAILVPTYIVFVGAPMNIAVPLSQATICGQSFFNMFLILRRHHPHHPPPASWPVVNFEYLAILLPFSMVGTLVGDLGNDVAPDWFRVVLLCVLLFFILYRLVKKTLHQRRKDKEEIERSLVKENGPVDSVQTPTQFDAASMASSAHPDKKPQIPVIFTCLICVAFAVQFVLTYTRSKKAGLVTCNGWEFWVIIAIAFVWNTLYSLAIRAYLEHKHKLVLEGILPPSAVPFKWNKKVTIFFPALSFAAGAAASMLGIGGGMILSFLLLEAGLTPEETSATGGVATFLVATQSASIFLIQGRMRWDYGLVFFFAGALATCLGQFVIVKEIKKRGLTYLIIVCLMTIMIGSLMSLTAIGIYNSVEAAKYGAKLGFGSLCKK